MTEINLEDKEISIIFPMFFTINDNTHKFYGGLEPRTIALAKYFADEGAQVNVLAPRGSSLNHKNIKIYNGNYFCWNGRDPQPYLMEKDLINSNTEVLRRSNAILEDNHFGYCRYLKMRDETGFPKLANSYDHHPDNLQSLPQNPQNIIAVSKWVMMSLREKFKNLNHNFYHAYSGLIFDNYPSEIDFDNKEENTWLYLSRFSTVKGPDIIIELAKFYKDEKFVMLGDTLFTQEGHYIRSLKEVADSLDNVKIIFNASYKEKIYYLEHCTGVLHPGRWEEPLGWDMLEGLYFGNKLLAFDRGAIREIYKHEKQGFIVPFSDNEGNNLDMFRRAFKSFKSKSIDPIACHQRIIDKFDFRKYSYPVYKEVLLGIKNTNPLI